jgi:hypothetical protein
MYWPMVYQRADLRRCWCCKYIDTLGKVRLGVLPLRALLRHHLKPYRIVVWELACLLDGLVDLPSQLSCLPMGVFGEQGACCEGMREQSQAVDKRLARLGKLFGG